MQPTPWLAEPSVSLAEAMAHSFANLTGDSLVQELDDSSSRGDIAEAMYDAEAGLLCHDGATDPRLIYANRAAQQLWKLDWDALVGMFSRLSAEPDERQSRAQMLAQAARDGFVTNYQGVRIASDGQRFRISGATVWDVTSSAGVTLGQAAVLPDWEFLGSSDD